MITISVNLKGVEPLLKRLAPSERGRRMRNAMEESVGFLRQEVVKGTPVDTGTAAGSITTAILGTPLDITGKVFSPLEYVSVLEEGRRPGSTMPPTEPIARWLSRKGSDPRLAFVVARAIGRRGTKGHKMFARAIERGRTQVRGIFMRHLTGGL